MDGLVIDAQARDKKGNTTHGLRASGLIPAVVYGHGIESTPIAVPEKLFSTGSMRNALVQVKLGRKKIDAIVHDVQYNPVSRKVLHVDFLKVDLNEAIDIHVPVHVTGTEAVESKNGIIQQQTREIIVHAKPQAVPDVVIADVSSLDVGVSLKVADLTLPAGVELRSEPEEVVVTILAAKRAEADDETDDAADTASEAADAETPDEA